MEYSANIPNIYYHEDNISNNHQRKGKTKIKYNENNLFKKINKHIKKHKLLHKISPYDVYKFAQEKKKKNKEIRNLQSKGRDYKLFMINNETGLNDSIVTYNEYYRWNYDNEYECCNCNCNNWYDDYEREPEDWYEYQVYNHYSSWEYNKYMW
jgi:hypothetical protein